MNLSKPHSVLAEYSISQFLSPCQVIARLGAMVLGALAFSLACFAQIKFINGKVISEFSHSPADTFLHHM